MEVISKKIELGTIDYFKKHLEILNQVLPAQLSEKEVEVLASFLALDKVLIEEDMFNPVARKKVKEDLKVSSAGLANYLKSMLKKGFLTKHPITGRITIKEYLVPEEKQQGYQILIVKKK